jgi:hypothetical protein
LCLIVVIIMSIFLDDKTCFTKKEKLDRILISSSSLFCEAVVPGLIRVGSNF